MHCGVSILIDTVIVRINEVAFNVREGFNFNLSHVNACSTGTHWRVCVVVNISTNDLYCNQTKVFNQHYNHHDHCYLGNCRPP